MTHTRMTRVDNLSYELENKVRHDLELLSTCLADILIVIMIRDDIPDTMAVAITGENKHNVAEADKQFQLFLAN